MLSWLVGSACWGMPPRCCKLNISRQGTLLCSSEYNSDPRPLQHHGARHRQPVVVGLPHGLPGSSHQRTLPAPRPQKWAVQLLPTSRKPTAPSLPRCRAHKAAQFGLSCLTASYRFSIWSHLLLQACHPSYGPCSRAAAASTQGTTLLQWAATARRSDAPFVFGSAPVIWLEGCRCNSELCCNSCN